MTAQPIDLAKDWVFRQMHGKNLVYNACWEDPRCDRLLLELDQDSEIVMITSAGCNALDYLLDFPARIHCVDVNPRQNALLELKLAAFERATFEDLFQLFGHGYHDGADELFQMRLFGGVSDYTKQYWTRNLHYFNGKGMRRTFYYYSTSGTFAWLTRQYLRTRRRLYHQVKQLFEAETLEEQRALYHEIEERFLNRLIEWVVNRHLTMSLVGVPRAQQRLIVERYENGTMGYIQDCLRRIFTQLPFKDNYFWQVYFRGSYTEECCPEYLKKENFESIRQQVRKIQPHTTTISHFLRQEPGPYSHFVLLDHQDWLAAHDVAALEEEWRLILQNSRPGTRILLRSAAETVEFFPDFVLDAVAFEKEKAAAVHAQDRVGTYASVYMGVVK